MNTRSTSPPEWTGRGSPAAESVARLLADWSAGPGTISGRLAAALRGVCEREEIGTGSRLPSERALAAALAVSRTTIVAAYEQLRQEGRVESRQGSGTRVLPRDGDPRAARERRFSGEAVPATSTLVLRTLAEDQAGSISFLAAHLPGAGEILERAFAKSRRELASLSGHHGYMPLGLPRLRAALARQLSDRGLPTREDEILVTNGAQQAIGLAAGLLLSPGDEVVLEDPTYPGAIDLFGDARARLLSVPPAGEPSAMERIAAALRRPRVRLLYLLPTFHNPTGAVLPERQRREIAKLAEQSAVPILEDQTLSDVSLGPPPPPPIAAFSRRGDVLTVGSLSKLYWGGLRIGWLRGPERLIHRLARRKAMEDLGSSVLSQIVAVRLLDEAEAFTKLRRRQVEERLDAMTRGLSRRLPDWTWKKPAGGLTLWTHLPRGNAGEFAQVAARHGVSVLPGPVCSPSNGFADFLRLAFVPEPAEIREGVDRLARAWEKYAVRRDSARARVGVIV
ncbi:MAG TPA: PLP-dependent aminotransferase family protein [Thermoanaerobaculia bacterium]|nr:PLP-dependent aminotransferase family protein [Thermoanaerobaculia bacterium]